MTPYEDLTFDFLAPGEVEDALKIEQEGYPADEAGSLESFRFRQSQAGSLFLGAHIVPADGRRKLVGYVCATLSAELSLTHKSMSNHVPGSSSICIHSICVSNPYKRKGIGLKLLEEYVNRIRGTRKEGQPYDRILLIAHEELRPFYEKAGFEWLGMSNVVHGSKPWYEMRLLLDQEGTQERNATIESLEAEPPAYPGQIPSSILEALLRPSEDKLSPKLVSDFPHDVADLLEIDPSKPGTELNKYDLLCPRGCRSVILKSGGAIWVERSSVRMEPEDFPHNPLLPALPPPPETAQWWLIRGSPMTFENIGFSRPVAALSTGTGIGPRLKLLTCAECDLGPLGWCGEGGSEFWLAVSRVGYRR